MADRNVSGIDLFRQLVGDSDDDSELEGFDIHDILQNATVRATIEFPQAENDRVIADDELWGWSREDSPPLDVPFTAKHGLNVELPDNSNPLDYFSLFFKDEMWDLLVLETNKFAHKRIESMDDMLPFCRLRNYKDVTIDEMKVFFALIIAMGLVKKSELESYWTTDETLETPFFGNNMAKDRFLAILSNLHMCNNENETFDPLRKIRPFILMLRNFSNIYTPDCNLSFDEATCPFKGRIKFKVYNPMKPHKFGLKLYQICESKSGYCVNFEVYCGKVARNCTYGELLDIDEESAQTTKIVTGLLAFSGLLNQGYRIYLDNYYYCSPELFDELSAHDTLACGTVRVC